MSPSAGGHLSAKEQPLVSILCVTYKHERFIKTALQGFLSQQADFPFEVLVGDDASPDKTPEILRDYATRYPDIIKPQYQEHNIGAGENIRSLIHRISGRYVCICDGDDYWTDPLKLKKQVDFMESHPEYSMCFHDITVTYDDGSQPDAVVDTLKTYPNIFKDRKFLAFPDILWLNPIASLSVIYRWQLGTEPPDWVFAHRVVDLSLHLLHAVRGDIGYINENMGTYRRHSGGVWWGHETDEHKKKNLLDYIALLKDVSREVGPKYDESLQPLLAYLQKDYDNYYKGDLKIGRAKRTFQRGYQKLKGLVGHFR